MNEFDKQNSGVNNDDPYYVYELRDPTKSNEVFYVGSGQGNRLAMHNQEESSPKGARIKLIESNNQKVLRVIIGRYETRQEAFAVESTLIKWVYGIDKLTNKIFGHGHESIRSRGIFEEIPKITNPRISPVVRQMSVIDYDDWIRNIDRISSERAKIIDEIFGIFVNIFDLSECSGQLYSRSTNTRLGLFFIPKGMSFDLEQVRQDYPLARIFSTGLTNAERIHISINKNPKNDFPKTDLAVGKCQLANLSGRDVYDRFDFLLNINNWNLNKERAKEFLEISFKEAISYNLEKYYSD